MARFGSPQRRPTSLPEPDDDRKVIVNARVHPMVKIKAVRAADALGISLAALLCELIERMEVDENGHPDWESRYAPQDDDTQEQLEMTA